MGALWACARSGRWAIFDVKLIERFWSRVLILGPNDCWEWQAGKGTDGYGRFHVGGKTQQAHRAAWRFILGAIPEGLVVRHKVCDNPACVNVVAHCELGTVKDNVNDMHQKGRQPDFRGEKHPGRKLNQAQVDEIRDIHTPLKPGRPTKRQAKSKTTTSALAKRFGVHKSMILSIVRGRNWVSQNAGGTHADPEETGEGGEQAANRNQG